MNSSLLLGDEAIAQAALDAGISGVYAYPGTPSTEITEYIQQAEAARQRGVHSHWSTNEKTAMEAALGMSFAGKRALVCMKHVGVNVAADAFMNAAVTGVVGGLVFVAADDPSMHSSQNEQDSRFYGQFALIPIFEPSSQQEAYNQVFEAFDLSEALGTPVMLRITTRLAHSRAGVTRKAERKENELRFSDNPSQFVLLPANARKQYNALLVKQAAFQEASVTSTANQYTPGTDRSRGFLAAGIAYNYLMEHFPDGCPHPVLKIGQYPLPLESVKTLAAACDELVVLEEGYPLIEDALKGLLDSHWVIRGRKDGLLPRTGELNPDHVAKALGLPAITQLDMPEVVRMRPPSLCTGCGHRDVFEALQVVYKEKADDCRIFGDIGCYTLGYLPPFRAMHACVDMGASITMAKGAADAGLKYPVAVIGDSTFTHSGMTSLLDAINERSPITVIISDNETTGMTGGQPSAGTGKLEAICLGLGVEPDHLHVMIPLKKNLDQMVDLLRREMTYNGVSVIIPRRECIQTVTRKKRS